MKRDVTVWLACGLSLALIGAAAWAADPAPVAQPGPAPEGAPMLFAPVTGTNGAAKASPFSAEISADFIKQIMETSAKIDDAKRAIAGRRAQLFANNPDIKAARAQMVALQRKINAILDADPELADLRISRDIVWSTMPVFPHSRPGGPMAPGGAGMPFPMLSPNRE